METKPLAVKRLFFDIETSPNVVLSWRVGYKIDLSPDNILAERKIICIGYKWDGEDKTTVLSWSGDRDDRTMLLKFFDVAKNADEIVGHFIDGFDMPWFRTRCIMLGIGPFPQIKTIDTKAWAAKNFYFNSNKLDYLAKILCKDRKIHTEFDLWKSIVLKNDRKSLAKMARYCAKDVEVLEKVFHKLQPWMKSKSHAGVCAGHDSWTCPICASTKVHKDKTRVSATGTKTHQMQCECGHYYTLSNQVYERYQKEGSRKGHSPQNRSRPAKHQGS